MTGPPNRRRGFTLIELLVVIAIIAILVALLLPAVQQVREAARKSQCQDHLHNLAIGVANYEVTFGIYPPGGVEGMGNNSDGILDGNGNDGYLYSWVLQILPTIEQKPLYDTITARARPRGPGLDAPWSRQAYWTTDIDVLLCPSDTLPQDRGESPMLLSYKACVGDTLRDNGAYAQQPNLIDGPGGGTRGMFGRRSDYKQRDFLDGASNTIMFGEMVIGTTDVREVLGGVVVNVTGNTPQACMSQRDPADPTRLLGSATVRTGFRPPGGRALDGRPYFVYFATAVPPNGPNCQRANPDGAWGHIPASSRHPGGAQIVMGDAKVAFISENIDTGNPNAASLLGNTGGRSPYGVWGALGTRASSDTARVP